MKTIRNIFCLFIFMALLLTAGTTARAADTYAVDPVHTFIVFKIRHLDIGYVLGMFVDFSGTIVADKENPEKSSVEMVVTAKSVDTNVKKRDDHLRSDSFLDAVKFPEIRFKSTKVKKIDETTLEVTGNMTLHGISREITVPVEFLGEGKDPWGGYRMAFSTDFDILRSDYGMDKELPGVGDKVHISLVTESIKK